MLKKASLFAIIVGFLCVPLHAQFWPLPDYTSPGVTKVCSQCPDASGLLTPGWADPVQRYVGRYVSSEYVGDFQQWFRTARAGGMRTTPDGSRVIVKLGNALASYDAASLIQRLDAHEPLVSVSTVPTNPTTTVGNRFGSYLELFLSFEHFFYAEFTGSGWKTPPADGQDRLLDYDVDDRGYVYLAYGSFGWGIGNDGAGSKLMPSYQDKNSLNWAPVGRIYWVKDGSEYYTFAGRIGDTFMHTYKTTGGTTNVVELSQFPKAITSLARGGTRTAIVDQNGDALYIYDNHSLVTGGAAQQTISYPGYKITAVVYDGTNFWVSAYTPTLSGIIGRISPSGTAWTHDEYPVGGGTGISQPLSFRSAGQYLVLLTLDHVLRIYKTATGRPVEVLVPSIPKYFANNGPGYASPTAHMALWEVDPIVVGGKLFLVVSGDGLGDIYQIRTDDGVIPSIVGTTGPANGNAPARAAADYFYGDTLRFTAALSSGASGNVNWNFGVPKDPANTLASTFGATVQHQYTGLVAADIAAPLTVTATNPATGSSTTLPLTLKTPQARFAFGGTTGAKTIVTLPGTDAPIVSDDSFYDASDGDTGGHYTDWRIGADAASAGQAAANYQTPATPVAVGGCGQHTLAMTAHYGYAAFGANNVDFPVTPAPGNGSSLFTYNVRAMAPAVDYSYNATTQNIEFISNSRAAAALTGRAVTYTWDVVDTANNNAVVATIAPITGTVGSVDLIPRYPVAKAKFSGTSTYRGRLTVTAAGADPCNPTSQSPMAAQAATSSTLTSPNAVLTPNCNAGVCQYSISSPTNSMLTDAWTFAWTAQGGSPSSGTASSLTVAYNQIGDFPLSVIVTNKSGLSSTLTYTAHITTAANPCPLLQDNVNVFLSWAGSSANSSCRDGGAGACVTNEPIHFSVTFYRYDNSCSPVWNYSWQVDNGATQNTESIDAVFPSVGSHTVKVTVTNGAGGSITMSRNLTISNGSVAPNPPPITPTPNPNPNPPSACATMTSGNTFIDYSSQTSSCKSGGTCRNGESIAFNVSFFNYDSSCAVHTFRWSFDGVAGGTGSVIAHTFATSGPHTVACTISNGTQTNYPVSTTVTTSGTVPTPDPGPTPNPNPACATLVPNVNFFLDYTGTTPTCHVSGACTVGEQITATISYWSYNSDCGTHTYNWKLDGSPIGTGKTATTTLTSGNHTLTCSVSNGGTPVDISQPVTVSVPATPTFTFDFTMTALPANIAPNSYVFNVVSIDPASAVNTATQQWTWNFGDGSPEVTLTGASGMALTHTFPDNNQYTVTVRAAGNSLVKSHTTPAPAARHRGAHH